MNNLTTLYRNVVLRAETISTQEAAYKTTQTLTIYKPDETTRDLLKGFVKGDTIDKLYLKDLFDNGEEDTHSSPFRYEVVTCFNGDSRKTNTFILILLNLDQMVRLR